jgi:membrane associated rhomboid family serine protease
MFLPATYFWLEPVLIGAAIVFVVSLLGNIIAFGSRVTNAAVTAAIFAVVFGALTYYGYGNVTVSVQSQPSASAPAKK